MLSHCRPEDLDALHRLMSAGGPVLPVAGGTDLLVAGRELPRQAVLVDLSAMPELQGIDTQARDIRIGAATTSAALEASAGLAARFPALVQAASECGSVQIRNRATIAGNIANAAAAADLIPPLLLAGARVEGLLPGGTSHALPLEDYRTGTGLVITAVTLPAGGFEPLSAYVKLGPRRDLTIARLNLAATARLERGWLAGLRIIAGAIGPRPIPLARAAAALEGQALTPDNLRGFLDALSAEVDAAIPGRASQAWKRQAIRGLGIDLLARLLGLSNRDPIFEGVC